MHVDLNTLYLLLIGTLFASALMTLWERRVHPKRSRELGILAAGFATLAIGCAAASWRREFPGALGSALSNLVIVSGYLLVLHGVAALNGRKHVRLSLAVLVLLALAWVIAGTKWQDVMWMYPSAIPISFASGMTAFELARGDGRKHLQAQQIAMLVSGAHAVLYAFRALILPWLVAKFGFDFLMTASKITMYEGVLYSVVLPMTLLRLVRDESHGQLLQQSQTDFLTGIGNRRWFFEQGSRVLGEGGAAQPVSLLAVDLDHFKKINDRYGHETGDRVLKSFADIARSVLGPDALLARIGGEEFAALLPGHDSFRAKEAGEALVVAFGGTTTLSVNGLGVEATVSVGLAQSASGASALVDLLAAADQALYRAKSLGGNRLVLAHADAASAAA
ncbi:GGDEF domain-containing protein [Paraburkholderia caribensis]|jgi:diguanylate cyclase (GGDEF)-like protein|uniref:GGDEF domain-containing protein n=1 Tax=Paraburkholderia caribensis TaxID=75105 RepID=UPI001CC7B86D|nr:GGDEF domain-containing protein [Paraburkholderia caribensis]MDR6384516.1 diguanylate cyclase (GGDEF)-like protein [Paraburkholderia caribensis]